MALPSTASFPQSSSVVSRWKLDEASGNRADSVGSNTLTDNNTVGNAAGISQANASSTYAADFEAGNSESLSITDAAQSGLDITGDLSFFLWMNPETVNGDFQIMQKFSDSGGANRAYRLFMSDDTPDTIRFGVSSNGSNTVYGSPASVHSLSAGTWYHIGIVYDASAGSVKVYKDGVQLGSTGTGLYTSINSGAASFYIGAYDGVSLFFDGVLQDAIIWNVALSDADVLDLYEAYTVAAPSNGLVNIERTPIRGVGRGIMRP